MSNEPSLPTRRDFIAQGGLAATALLLGVRPLAAAEPPSKRYPIIVFSLPFQAFDAEQTADLVAECGYDGIECPVRAEGQIEPERVADELPKYVEALRKRKLDFALAATDIIRIDQPHAEKVLRTLSQQGVRRLRLGFQTYDLSQPLAPQLQGIAAALKDIAAACRELGLQAGFQNHSGPHQVGGPVWDVYSMIRDLDPKHMGFCFDIGHATVEGGLCWPVQAKLAEPFYSAVYVKDFVWKRAPGGWTTQWCPLGEGMVSRTFLDQLKKTGFRGPISQQFFFPLGERGPMAALMRKDLAVLNAWLDA
jgi:sugar phosphate isomerase/epimerase